MKKSEIAEEPGRMISRVSDSEFESEVVMTVDGLTFRVRCKNRPGFLSADDSNKECSA